MINLYINGQAKQVSADLTINQLAEEIAIKQPYAVAINGEFIVKNVHDEKHVLAGDSIEFLSPIQGG